MHFCFNQSFDDYRQRIRSFHSNDAFEPLNGRENVQNGQKKNKWKYHWQTGGRHHPAAGLSVETAESQRRLLSFVLPPFCELNAQSQQSDDDVASLRFFKSAYVESMFQRFLYGNI